MKRRNNFLEQLKRRQQADASRDTSGTEKPIEQMSDTELDAALQESKRALLGAQHEELRGRELARLGGGNASSGASPTLADVLRGQRRKGKGRHW